MKNSIKFFLIFLITQITFINKLIQCGVISSSSIELCTLDGTELSKEDKSNLNCEKKLVVALYIDSQKENTETYNFDVTQVKDENDKVKTLLMPISISFKKSETFINYPLVYLQTVASEPKEQILYKSDYFVTSSCKDKPTDHTCPGAKDSNGKLIRDSQGFCCSCSFSDYIGEDQNLRGNLKCSFGDKKSAAAFCLQFGEFKHDVFRVEKTQVEYDITATVGYTAPEEGGGDNQIPITEDIKLSNSVPMGKDSRNQVIVRIIGDFSTSTQIKQYTDKLIVFPSDRDNSVNTCMVLDSNYFDLTGVTCNKIGVSYSAFQNQPNSCAALSGSCLQNQIADYYNSDVALVSKGKKGNYIVSQLATKVVIAGKKESRSLKIRFDETHRTMLTITVKADSLQYLVNISPGKIINYQIERFESMSNNGILRVNVQNTGTISADYTLSIVNCTGDINDINNQQVTIQSKQIYSFTFEVYTTTKLQSYYYCYADLYNEVSQVIASVKISFNTSKTEIDFGAQFGENSIEGDPLNIGSEFTCDDVCPNLINVLCYYTQLEVCATKFALLLTAFIIIVIVAVLCFKFPVVRNLIKFIFCCGFICCKGKKKESKKSKSSSKKNKDSDSDSSSDSDEGEKNQKEKRNKNKEIKMLKLNKNNNNNNSNNNRIQNYSNNNNNNNIIVKRNRNNISSNNNNYNIVRIIKTNTIIYYNDQDGTSSSGILKVYPKIQNGYMFLVVDSYGNQTGEKIQLSYDQVIAFTSTSPRFSLRD